MESLEARVNSFLKSKRIKKNSKSNSTSATVKWPHPISFNANPNTLAEAGFYWAPSWEDRDTVTCFLCFKELSDWNDEDDPFQVHWEKCGSSCAWAMVRCGLSQDTADDGSFVFSDKRRLPMSKTMEDARLRTFGNLWPHDTDDDYIASSAKMAQAGFVYTPHAKGDDTATCLYCKVSLGGWDKDDDPMLEHKKRAIKSDDQCPFFSASSSKPPHSKKTSTEAPIPPKPRTRKTRAVSRTRSKQIDTPFNLDENPDSGDELAKSEVIEEVRAPKTRGKGRMASTSKPSTSKTTATGKKFPSVSTKSTRATMSKPALAKPSNSDLANSSDAELVNSEVEVDVITSETKKLMAEANVDMPGIDDTPVQQAHHDDLTHDQQPNDVGSDDFSGTPQPPSRLETLDDNMPMVVDETLQLCGHHLPLPSPPLPSRQSTQLETLPVPHPEMLTPEDRCLTVEQWIRREIEISYDQLRQDGRKQILLFEGRAREVRQIIEAL